MVNENAKQLMEIYYLSKTDAEFYAIVSERFPNWKHELVDLLYWTIELAFADGYKRHREAFHQLNKGKTTTIE